MHCDNACPAHLARTSADNPMVSETGTYDLMTAFAVPGLKTIQKAKVLRKHQYLAVEERRMARRCSRTSLSAEGNRKRWIIQMNRGGITCHMCLRAQYFDQVYSLHQPRLCCSLTPCKEPGKLRRPSFHQQTKNIHSNESSHRNNSVEKQA